MGSRDSVRCVCPNARPTPGQVVRGRDRLSGCGLFGAVALVELRRSVDGVVEVVEDGGEVRGWLAEVELGVVLTGAFGYQLVGGPLGFDGEPGEAGGEGLMWVVWLVGMAAAGASRRRLSSRWAARARMKRVRALSA